MKKILVIGMSSVLGGVETYIYNLVSKLYTEFSFDFLVVGRKEKSVFEDKINTLFKDNRNHFFYSLNLKENYKAGREWLKRFYSLNHYDIIYLNTCTNARIIYCKDALKQGVALITHSHNGSGASTLNNFLCRRYVLKKSQKLLACSDLASKWLFGRTKRKVEFVPNGVDLKRFSFNKEERTVTREKYNLNSDIVVGHVGRFSYQKNHEFFIKLARHLGENFKFLLAGDGPLKNNFIAEIVKSGLQHRFIICDNTNEVEKLYSAMDIFVMPSLFEGLPIVAIEAQCSGLPCIFSDTISRQTALSNHCKFVSLDRIEDWLNQIHDTKFISRYDGVPILERNGFSLEACTNKIRNIFMELSS